MSPHIREGKVFILNETYFSHALSLRFHSLTFPYPPTPRWILYDMEHKGDRSMAMSLGFLLISDEKFVWDQILYILGVSACYGVTFCLRILPISPCMALGKVAATAFSSLFCASF